MSAVRRTSAASALAETLVSAPVAPWSGSEDIGDQNQANTNGSVPESRVTTEPVNLFDFVQHECMRGLTRAVLVTVEDEEGVLYFDDGQLVHAETRRLEGEEAALSILGWKQGRLEPSAGYWVRPNTIETSWQGLLMKAAQRLDEARRCMDETVGPPQAEKVFSELEEFIEFKDASLSRAVRLDSEGVVIASRGDMQDFPDAACYAVRLAELIGEGLGLENFSGLECVTTRKVMIAYVDDDMLVAVEGELSSDLSGHRRRAGT